MAKRLTDYVVVANAIIDGYHYLEDSKGGVVCFKKNEDGYFFFSRKSGETILRDPKLLVEVMPLEVDREVEKWEADEAESD